MMEFIKSFLSCLKPHLVPVNEYSPVNETSRMLSLSEQERIKRAIERASLQNERMYQFQEHIVRRYCTIWRLINLGER